MLASKWKAGWNMMAHIKWKPAFTTCFTLNICVITHQDAHGSKTVAKLHHLNNFSRTRLVYCMVTPSQNSQWGGNDDDSGSFWKRGRHSWLIWYRDPAAVVVSAEKVLDVLAWVAELSQCHCGFFVFQGQTLLRPEPTWRGCRLSPAAPAPAHKGVWLNSLSFPK